MAAGRSSALQDLLDKMRADNRKQVVHCAVCISRISPHLVDKRDIGQHYERIFKTCQAKYQGEGPTGLLLVYPQHCLHLIEAPWEVLIDVIQDLHSNHELLSSSRVVSFSPHIQQRLYPQWAVRVLSLPALAKGEQYTTQDTLEITVAGSLEKLYKLGVHLSKLTQHQLKATMDSLTSKVPQFLLQQDILEYYLVCSDLNSPAEFLTRYNTPTHILLDRELVWPLPVKLFPYDD
ncbi:testis-expressed protein 47-like [Halichondria panicea]|uniref:testis-expressed protein 47-like n=1 Tax=Halichondria panicea TaxID=6063 RepID=UPI00312B3BA0